LPNVVVCCLQPWSGHLHETAANQQQQHQSHILPVPRPLPNTHSSCFQCCGRTPHMHSKLAPIPLQYARISQACGCCYLSWLSQPDHRLLFLPQEFNNMLLIACIHSHCVGLSPLLVRAHGLSRAALKMCWQAL
jgi:hypothetical protein